MQMKGEDEGRGKPLGTVVPCCTVSSRHVRMPHLHRTQAMSRGDESAAASPSKHPLSWSDLSLVGVRCTPLNRLKFRLERKVP